MNELIKRTDELLQLVADKDGWPWRREVLRIGPFLGVYSK